MGEMTEKTPIPELQLCIKTLDLLYFLYGQISNLQKGLAPLSEPE